MTSSGGVGSSAVLSMLKDINVATNDPDNHDKLKHMPVGDDRKLPARLGDRPVILFAFDDPVEAMLSLVVKDWLNLTTSKLESQVQDAPMLKPEHSRFWATCQHIAKIRHRSHATGRAPGAPVERGGCIPGATQSVASNSARRLAESPALPLAAPPAAPPILRPASSWTVNQTARSGMVRCVELSLLIIGNTSAFDTAGFERHYRSWLHAACTGRAVLNGRPAPVVFVRSSTLQRHYQELSALVNVSAHCVPSAWCQHPTKVGLRADLARIAPQREARETLAQLEQTYEPLRRLQRLVGDFLVVPPPLSALGPAQHREGRLGEICREAGRGQR